MKIALHFVAVWALSSAGFAVSASAQNPVPASPAAAVPRPGPVQSPADTSAAPPNPAAANASGSGTVASAASADYILSPADTVEMTVFRQPDLTTRSPIAGDGSVQFPLIGEVKIAGMALRNARELIRKRYNADYLVEPQVSLNVVGYAQRTFTILGQVAKPGTYDFPGGKRLNLLEAVGVAGGFTRLADRHSVQIKHSDSENTITVNVNERGKRNKSSLELQPNDVVTVGESWW